MKFKYIIFEVKNMEVPVIFSQFLEHDSVRVNGRVVSAGFVRFSADCGVDCYGKSVSLQIESRGKQDAEIILNDPSL